MNSKLYLLCFAFLSFYLGCNQYDKSQLIGTWKATKVLEEGNAMKLKPNEISFSFNQKNQYQYTGTIGYQEAGTYRLEGDLLLSKDTTRQGHKEKAVKILQLHSDSLRIEMLADGKEQTIHLVKHE